jgi:TrpR family transcriptional regulator, trp operon repressor
VKELTVVYSVSIFIREGIMKLDEKMIKAFCTVDRPEDMRKLFLEIFTPSELEALNLRWKLLTDLSTGHTQRDIAKRLGISLCKITRGAKILKDRKTLLHTFFLEKTK